VVADSEPFFDVPGGPLTLAAHASVSAGEVFDAVRESEQPENNSFGVLQ
jgi:hypothetical protein